MKTKQKAIRRIPTVSCPPPLDLSSDVEDMDYQLQSLKGDRSLSDVMGLHTCPENTTKRICTEKSRLLQHTTLQEVQVLSKQNKVVANSTSSHTIPSHCENSLKQHDTADCVEIKSKEYIHGSQGTFGSVLSKVDGRSHVRISHNYVPVDNQITNRQSKRTRPVPSISETPQRRSKRPRFTQVRQQDLCIANNTVRADTTQRRRMRQGPPSTYLSIDSCHQVLDRHNELVKFFRTARDKIERADIPDFKIKLFGVVGSKQYDLPAGDCIGAIVFEGGPNVETNYDVIIEPRGGQPHRIDKLNPHYMSLHFPLLFIHGDEGYHIGLKLLGKGGESAEKEKQMTMKMWNLACLKDRLGLEYIPISVRALDS
ncbi:hypothetical protein CTI12_AA195620 [Artemisia annua]|uniref:Helitron helicase-like domain-containing protein n=1 Tax=Artemisia annua TaxID=35608 RepID=A0A2U1P495_ARTAN|nr:hypothetical protein CTI12_AA195620 [Artemisia annua]